MKKFVNLTILSGVWENYHRAKFTEALSCKFKSWSDFIVSENPVSLTVNLFYKFKTRFLGLFLKRLKKRIIFKNTELFTPWIIFNSKFWKISLCRYIDSFLWGMQIYRHLSIYYKNKKIILYICLPEHFYLLKFIKYDILVFDYFDNYAYSIKGELDKKKQDLIDQIIFKSDLILCTAKKMYDYSYSKNPNTLLLPNASNIQILNKSSSETVKTELDNISVPIIGYAGVIRDWINFPLIQKVLKRFSHSQVIFIGPVERNVKKELKKLTQYDNFVHLPYKPLELLPAYLNKFSVGIIPFVVTEFTAGVMPNKFYDYLAAKIPIVSSGLIELSKFSGLIGYSETDEAFLSNIDMVIEGNFNLDTKLYNALLKEDNWNKRTEIVETYLQKNILKSEYKKD